MHHNTNHSNSKSIFVTAEPNIHINMFTP